MKKSLIAESFKNTQKQNRPAPNYTYVYPIAELEKVMANHQGLDLTKSYQQNMKEKESFSLPKQEKKPSHNSNENILKMLIKIYTLQRCPSG